MHLHASDVLGMSTDTFINNNTTDTAPPVTYWIHTDHRGAAVATTDPLSLVRTRITYDPLDPFGAATVTGTGPDLPWRLPNHYFDAETGLYYNWHRYYNPAWGRYMSPDLAKAVQPYAYAGGVEAAPALVQEAAPIGEVVPWSGGQIGRIRGVSREAQVALIEGGEVSGAKISPPLYKYTDIDVLAPNGDLVMVGGKAKTDLGNLGRVIKLYQAEAAKRGVGVKAYLASDTPPEVLEFTAKRIGADNVHVFDDAF